MSSTTLSREDLRSYRETLQSLADRLTRGVAWLTAEATRPTGADGTEAVAGESIVTSSEGDEEVARGVLMSEGQLLEEVQAALTRLDAGTFGRCERCAQPVGQARLAAVPYARHCIRCASIPADET